MLVTISNSQETGVSVYMFAKLAPRWVEVTRLEPGKQDMITIETAEPALIVTWRKVKQGYQVEQIKVAKT